MSNGNTSSDLSAFDALVAAYGLSNEMTPADHAGHDAAFAALIAAVCREPQPSQLPPPPIPPVSPTIAIKPIVSRKTKARYVKAEIPNELRWAVWERDNFTCQHCGSRRSLAVDHIYPESKGGPTTLDNCQTLCKRCNSKKGDRIA